jgi:hypothetical protein
MRERNEEGVRLSSSMLIPSPSSSFSHLAAPASGRGVRRASNAGREAKRVTTSSTLLNLVSLNSALNVDDEGKEEEEEGEKGVEATRRAKGRRSVASSPICPTRQWQYRRSPSPSSSASSSSPSLSPITITRTKNETSAGSSENEGVSRTGVSCWGAAAEEERRTGPRLDGNGQLRLHTCTFQCGGF